MSVLIRATPPGMTGEQLPAPVDCLHLDGPLIALPPALGGALCERIGCLDLLVVEAFELPQRPRGDGNEVHFRDIAAGGHSAEDLVVGVDEHMPFVEQRIAGSLAHCRALE
jgi:hypothetical protein